MAEYITNNFQQTIDLAQQLAAKFKPGVVCLSGELAAGKTTFTQGLGAYFGIDRIVSPTYIISREYQTKKNNLLIKKLVHIDLYRLSSVQEAKSFDIAEQFSDQNALIVIEWPDRLKELLPDNYIKITFTSIDQNKRKIEVS